MRSLGAALLGVAASIGVASADVATWNRYDRLLCQGEHLMTCVTATGACETRPSQAEFRVDFTTRAVFTQAYPEPERILSREFWESTYDPSETRSAIFLSGAGRMMSFGQANSRGRIPAVMIEASGAQTRTHTLECMPD